MMTRTKIALTGIVLSLATGVAFAAPAADNWDNLCASCHGADGKAQTKIGKKMKIRDYTDAKVQAELTDEYIIKATADGVTVDGKEKMKGFKSELSADEIKDFVAFIRKFKA
ncbi:MAG: cytochrome c [Lacunisphaera sp.]|nr:cytochrome c [Lacunisphaera sp.]